MESLWGGPLGAEAWLGNPWERIKCFQSLLLSIGVQHQLSCHGVQSPCLPVSWLTAGRHDCLS